MSQAQRTGRLAESNNKVAGCPGKPRHSIRVGMAAKLTFEGAPNRHTYMVQDSTETGRVKGGPPAHLFVRHLKDPRRSNTKLILQRRAQREQRNDMPGGQGTIVGHAESCRVLAVLLLAVCLTPSLSLLSPSLSHSFSEEEAVLDSAISPLVRQPIISSYACHIQQDREINAGHTAATDTGRVAHSRTSPHTKHTGKPSTTRCIVTNRSRG